MCMEVLHTLVQYILFAFQGWVATDNERNWYFRLRITYAKKVEDTKRFTCVTPRGMTNSISVNVTGQQTVSYILCFFPRENFLSTLFTITTYDVTPAQESLFCSPTFKELGEKTFFVKKFSLPPAQVSHSKFSPTHKKGKLLSLRDLAGKIALLSREGSRGRCCLMTKSDPLDLHCTGCLQKLTCETSLDSSHWTERIWRNKWLTETKNILSPKKLFLWSPLCFSSFSHGILGFAFCCYYYGLLGFPEGKEKRAFFRLQKEGLRLERAERGEVSQALMNGLSQA